MNKSFLQNSIISIVFYGLSSIAAIIYSIFLGRELGTDGLGKINLISLMLATSNIVLNLGIGQALVFFNFKKSKNSVVFNSLIITLVISLFSIIIFFLNTGFIVEYFSDLPMDWLCILIIITPFIHLKNLAEYYYASVGNFFLNSGLNFIDVFLKLAFSFFLISLFPIVDSFFYSIIFVTIIVGLIPWIIILKNIDLKRQFNNFDFAEIFSLLKFGIPSYLSVLVAFLSLRVDQLLIGAYMNIEDLGIYVVAVIFAELPFKVSNALTKVLFAKVSTDAGYLTDFTIHTLKIVLFISIVIIIIIIFLGKYFVSLLFGENFQNVYPILLYLLPGSFFFNITQILSSDLSGRGFPSLGMKSGVILLFISIISNLFIIPRFGLFGVAAISSLNYLLSSSYMLYYFCRITKTKLKDVFSITKSDFNFKYNVF